MIKNRKPVIIAEIGSVHDGSFGNCLKLIDCAKESGADIVKLQHHFSEDETIKEAPNPYYFKGENRHQYFERTSFNLIQWKKIINFCKKKKIDFLCSVFSIYSYNFLKKLGIKKIKIPSGEITNHPLLSEISKNRKLEIFMSTGMSNYKEIDQAVKILKNNNLKIMQCTSIYPCPPDQVGINVVEEFKKKYKKYDIGFSDHTKGNTAAILALSSGSIYFEKHLTFSKKMYGSDAKYATEPKEFYNYVQQLNEAYIIINNKIDKNKINHLKSMKKVFQKSILFSKDLKKGDVIKYKDLCYKKPDIGISAKKYRYLINRKLKKNVKKDQYLKFSDFI